MFDYCTNGEAKAAKALIQRILDEGYMLSVNDSSEGDGEWTVVMSIDFDKICNALNSTEGDTLKVRALDGVNAGLIYLIWGNDPDGSELIADYTANPTIESLCEA